MNPTPAQAPTIPGTASLSVRTLRSFEEVEELRGVWEKWQFHPNSDLDYYLSRFRVRPEYIRPHVIVVYRDGRPDAMLVGRLDDSRVDLKIGYLHLPRPRVRALGFPYAGMLGNQSSENCRTVVNSVIASLAEREADVASFNNVRVDSPIYNCVTRLPNLLCRDYFPAVNLHHSMRMPASAREILSGLSAKWRKTLRWQANRLLKIGNGDVRVSCFSAPEQLEEMIRDVEDVARKTFQRGLGVGFLDNLEMRERMGLAAKKGWLRVYLLYVANKPCAFWAGTLYGDTYYLDFTGYDAAFAKYSPGMSLLMEALGDLCENNVRQVDFTYGFEEYKQRFGNCKWQEAMVNIYAPTARGVGLKIIITLTLLIDRLARQTLNRINLLPRLKKFWRRRVTNREPAAPRDETEPEQ